MYKDLPMALPTSKLISGQTIIGLSCIIRLPAVACLFLLICSRTLFNIASTFFSDGLIIIFPSLYLRICCPRKSNPSSICVILVFSLESSSPLSFRNVSTRGLTSFSSNSFELPVIMRRVAQRNFTSRLSQNRT
jgi:hypothetical protein